MKFFRALARVCKYLGVWAEPPREYDKFTPVPSFAEAADEPPDEEETKKKERIRRHRHPKKL